MRMKSSLLIVAALIVSLVLISYTATWAFQKEAQPQGTPVLWKDPGDMSSRDLFAGPGGDSMKPDLSRVVFNGSEQGGYSVKWRVLDGAGKEWVVKLGNEARPETAATRLTWAVGYATEVNYLVPCLKIVNAPKPRKEVERCEGDGWADVRFEARPKDVKRLDSWSWQSGPFAGTKELKGLVILMALFNNWDLKDDNNKVIYVPGSGGQGELQYIVSDLGATFGKTGNFITHSRNEPEKYVKTKFVEKVEGGKVKFDFDGKNSALFENITVEDAAWIGGLLSRLSDKQLADAFRAANFTPEETSMLVQEVRSRINELAGIAGPVGEPVGAAAPAATPSATPAPEPTPAATPSPESTPAPEPTPMPEPTPAPTPAATPAPTPTPERGAKGG